MDIVERLRNEPELTPEQYWEAQADMWHQKYKEAADEIDLLRQYKSELEDATASNNPTEIFNKSARLEGLLTALKEKK